MCLNNIPGIPGAGVLWPGTVSGEEVVNTGPRVTEGGGWYTGVTGASGLTTNKIVERKRILLTVTCYYEPHRPGWCDNYRLLAVWSCQYGDPVDQRGMININTLCIFHWPHQMCRPAIWQNCVSGDRMRAERGWDMSRGCPGEHTALI